VKISRIVASDLAQLHPLVEGYRAFYKQEANTKTEQYLLDRIANDEVVGFIARTDEGEAVGFTLIYPTFSTVSLSHIWLLNDLFVVPEARGAGVASALMDTAEQAAKDAGATRIFLRTAHTNTPAQALYESRGWVYDEVFKRYDLIF
jgi:ribosomal protein S18 acetylase RimI-like enzyme